jgi:hypothetical protein
MSYVTIVRGIVLTAAAAAVAPAQTAVESGRLGAVLSAQPVPAGVAFSGSTISSVGFAGGGMAFNGVTGQPFSAMQESETIQTLADGTHITQGVQKVMYYRDSLGRVRTERTAVPPPGFADASQKLPVFIEIQDQVGGYRYSFDSNSKTVHRFPMGPNRPIARNAAGFVAAGAPVQTLPAKIVAAEGRVANSRPRPEISNENLGSQTIEGLLAEGTRTTTTWPTGSIGNDRPVTSTQERWMSRDLGVEVLTKRTDLRSGDTTTKLTNISRSEPDASLFQPPAGSEIVDPEIVNRSN